MNLLVVPMASSLRCFEPGAVMLRTRLELNAYGGSRIRLAPSADAGPTGSVNPRGPAGESRESLAIERQEGH